MNLHPSSPAKTLYILHHSRTDAECTDLRERVESRHVDVIRRALEIGRRSRSRIDGDFSGFRWNCETFWAVERFLERAAPDEVAELKKAIRDGDIGLSGSYLNFNALLDYDVLAGATGRAARFGRAIGVPVDSAMTADFNGYGWGFSQALYDNGIGNLFACVHVREGTHPPESGQGPFWWETPKGDKILVWRGERHLRGDEPDVVPDAEIRIPMYFEMLENQGYTLPFAPVAASGPGPDNGPPSPKIIEFIQRWNALHGDRIRVEMATLSEFFRLLRNRTAAFPVYRGDWPDSSPVGAVESAKTTKLFRQAQRDLALYKHILDRYPHIEKTPVDKIEYDLSLYAERTLNRADAVSRPWDSKAEAVAERKKVLAVEANAKIQSRIDWALRTLGAAPSRPEMRLRYKVINPLPRSVSGIAKLNVQHVEFHELRLDRGAEVVDAQDGRPIPCQMEPVPAGADYCVHVGLGPGEERILELRPAERDASLRIDEDPTGIETHFAVIEWREGDGIVRWFDKGAGRDLVRTGAAHGPFSPVYEITPEKDPNWMRPVRGETGLQRKGSDFRRSVGVLTSAGSVRRGDVFSAAELNYAVDGLRFYSVELKAYTDESRVDAAVRMNKVSAWEPENLYIPLPFNPRGDELWLDKAGCGVRPWKDRLPGTLTDFHTIQEGAAVVGSDGGTALAVPDTHMIRLGDLDDGTRPLHGHPGTTPRGGHMYARLMTNSWETNLEGGRGGFYEFRYSIKWDESFSDAEAALAACGDMNHGIRCFRMEPVL